MALLRGFPLRALCAGLAMFLVADRAVSQGPPVGSDPWRFGVLFWHDSPNDSRAFDGIRDALRARGYPHRVFRRDAGEDPDRIPEILAEFRRADVDLIFTLGTQATLQIAKYERRLPIVFTAVTHPVRSGIVPDWTGSGRNIAGNSNWIAPDTVARVFRLAVPDLTRLGVLRSTDSKAVSGAEVQGMQQWLAQQDPSPFELLDRVVSKAEGKTEADVLTEAAEALIADGAQAIWIPIDHAVYTNLDPVTAVARKHHIPLLSSTQKAADQAVASVLIDYELLGQRSVVLALDVLEKKRSPSALEIGRMAGSRTVLNLDAARRLEIELPLKLLATADRVIDSEREERDGR